MIMINRSSFFHDRYIPNYDYDGQGLFQNVTFYSKTLRNLNHNLKITFENLFN
jgi:hypothetical protein